MNSLLRIGGAACRSGAGGTVLLNRQVWQKHSLRDLTCWLIREGRSLAVTYMQHNSFASFHVTLYIRKRKCDYRHLVSWGTGSWLFRKMRNTEFVPIDL